MTPVRNLTGAPIDLVCDDGSVYHVPADRYSVVAHRSYRPADRGSLHLRAGRQLIPTRVGVNVTSPVLPPPRSGVTLIVSRAVFDFYTRLTPRMRRTDLATPIEPTALPPDSRRAWRALETVDTGVLDRRTTTRDAAGTRIDLTAEDLALRR